jgi:cytidine deaminase
VCAERVALFSAVHAGKRKFKAIAIVGGKTGESPSKLFSPCGVCRQALSEFSEQDFRIIMTDGKSAKVMTLGELLPLGFTSDSFQM